MSGLRRAFLDRSPGEVRGVVTLDGRPERLLIEREDDAAPRVGDRYAARVEAVSARMGLARLDVGEGASASLRLRSERPPPIGERLIVEVVAEGARGKPAVVRRCPDPAAGERPRRLSSGPDTIAQLAALGFPEPEMDETAREAADEAQGEALATAYGFADGLNIAVEPTRGLTAVDVDLAEGVLPPARANLLAVAQAARLLRLKGLGGLIVIDLVGFPRDARSLLQAAVCAFAPDGPEVAIAGPGRFGVLEVARPSQRQPIHERLLAPGGLDARTLAQETVRALEREGRSQPGALLTAHRPPDVAALSAPFVRRLGPRFAVVADPGVARWSTDILTR